MNNDKHCKSRKLLPKKKHSQKYMKDNYLIKLHHKFSYKTMYLKIKITNVESSIYLKKHDFLVTIIEDN